MSKCPLCGSEGDDLVFRFYCQNKGCANFVAAKDPFSEFKVDPAVYKQLVPESEKPLEGIGLVDKSPTFRIASIKRPLPALPPIRIFSLPFRYRKKEEYKYAKELQAEWLDTDRDFEVMKEHIYAGLGVPREFLEPGHGSCPGKDFPHFKLVLSPFDNSLMLYWYDQVPAVLNTLIHPILENKVGTPMTGGLEGTTQHQIIERLLDMVRKGQLVRNETRYRWELHFME